jgi:hypothetical protein
LEKYKYDTWRILSVKCYIDNSMRLRSCIRNVNMSQELSEPQPMEVDARAPPGRVWTIRRPMYYISEVLHDVKTR